MSKPVRILGIAGSLRRQSYNRGLLRAAARLAPEDATIDIQPEVMIGDASEHFDTAGDLTDDKMRAYVRRLLQSLVDWTRRIGQQTGSSCRPIMSLMV